MKKRISIIIFLVTMVALLAAVACGSSSTATVPDQPPPTETPIKGPPPSTETPLHGDPSPEEPAPVAVPAPIEDVTVVFPGAPGGEYTLKITSGLSRRARMKWFGYNLKLITANRLARYLTEAEGRPHPMGWIANAVERRLGRHATIRRPG